MSGREEEKVKAVIHAAFEAGRNRNFGILSRIHDESLSKFGDAPPFEIQSMRDALMFEEIGFASLSDYNYEIQNLNIKIIDRVAVATFMLGYSGVLVDNTTFGGQVIKAKSRATFVLAKRDTEWLIVHEHLSRIPEQYTAKKDQA